MAWVRVLGPFVLGVLCAAILSSAASSWFVLDELAQLGAPTSGPERLTAIAKDFVGLAPALVPLLAGASAVAYGAAWALSRLVPRLSGVFFGLLGAGASIAVVMGLETIIGQPVIAGARTGAGLGAQALAGAIGGLIFALALGPPKVKPKASA